MDKKNYSFFFSIQVVLLIFIFVEVPQDRPVDNTSAIKLPLQVV